MSTVRVSPKFQIVIPKEFREKLKLKPGQEFVIFEREGSLRLVLRRPFSDLKGLAKGIRWEESDRDHTERL